MAVARARQRLGMASGDLSQSCIIIIIMHGCLVRLVPYLDMSVFHKDMFVSGECLRVSPYLFAVLLLRRCLYV